MEATKVWEEQRELQLINIISKGGLRVSSRDVARDFQKQHKHVTRDIENVLGVCPKLDTPLFIETTYINEQNKQEYKEYLMTRDGFTLLAMGFNGERAFQWKLKYIEAFNKMEEQLKNQQLNLPSTYKEALLKLVEAEEEKEKLHTTIEENKHHVEFSKAIDATGYNIKVEEFVKILANSGVIIGRNDLFKWLRKNGYINSNPFKKNQPYQEYVTRGYLTYTEHPVKNFLSFTPLITPRGQKYFTKKLLKEFQEQLVFS